MCALWAPAWAQVINERRILEEASHPFCVKLCGAYQDRDALYLLQVRGAAWLRCVLEPVVGGWVAYN